MATAASASSSEGTASSPVSSPPPRPPIDENSAQLYINNISFSTTEAALSAWIASRIGVTPSAVNIIINKRTEKSKGYGFVTIPKTSVDMALTLNGEVLDERPVSVARAVDLTDEERQEKRDKRDEKRKAARSKREADRAAAAANGTTATENNNTSNTNAASSPNTRTPKGEKKQTPASAASSSSSSKPKTPRPPPVPRTLPPNTTQLYLSNLAFDTTEADIRTLVAQTLGVAATPPSDANDSNAIHVEVVADRWRKNRSRGYAFITVNNSLVDKALAMDGAELHERKIKVALAKERKPAEEIETDGGQADNGTQNAATGSSSTGDGVEPVTVHRRPFRAPRRNRAKKTTQQQGEEKTAEAATAKNGDNSANHAEQQPSSSTVTANGEGKKKRRYPPRRRGAAAQDNTDNSNTAATSSTNA